MGTIGPIGDHSRSKPRGPAQDARLGVVPPNQVSGVLGHPLRGDRSHPPVGNSSGLRTPVVKGTVEPVQRVACGVCIQDHHNSARSLAGGSALTHR